MSGDAGSRRRRRETPGEIVFKACNLLFMFFVVFITLFPFYHVIVLSVSDPAEFLKGGIGLLPKGFTLINYLTLWKDPGLFHAGFVSVARTAVGTLCSVFFTAAFAYGMSKSYLLGRKTFMVVTLITMYFSGGLIPYYLLIRSLGLMNSFLVYVLPMLFSAFNAAIMMTFFRSIDKGIEESAKLDGANELQIFIRLILPVSSAIVATVALFNGVNQWNSWFDAMLFGGARLKTLALVLMQIIQSNEMVKLETYAPGFVRPITAESLKLAIMVVNVLPIVLIYPFLQRYFVKGMMIGSMKG